MRRLLLVFLLFLSAATAWAVPAPPHPFPVQQPDGTTLTVQAHGDEQGLFFETEDGYTVVQDANKTWRYAQRGSDGKLQPSAVEAGKGDPARVGVKKHERHDDATMKAQEKKRNDVNEARRKAAAQRWQAARSGGPAAAPLPGATTMATQVPGSLPPSFQLNPPSPFRLAVLLLEFPAEGAEAAVPFTYTPAQIGELILSEGTYNTSPLGKAVYGSVRDYYSAVSYGKFTLTGQVFPAVTADHGKSYYLDSATEFVIPEEAVVKSGVDLSQFDGYMVMYAGNLPRVAGYHPLVPHMMSDDGYNALPYLITPEKFYTWENGYDTPDLSEIGVICHELGHVLGLSDLYQQGNGGWNVSTWSVMGGGSYGGDYKSGWRPTQLLPVEKEMLGWLAPEVVSQTTSLADPWPWLVLPPVADTGAAYKVRTAASWYYLENRQRTGYDLLLPDQGLLLWHVDYTSTVWTDSTRPILALVHSGYYPSLTPPFLETDAAFPGAGQHTNFGLYQSPSCADYDGVCRLKLSNITANYGGTRDVGFQLYNEWPVAPITIDGVTGTFPSIGVALDVASPGQTVRVGPGTFNGPVVMKQGVNLVGAGAGRSIIQAPDASTSLLVRGANDTTLSGFSLHGFDYLNSAYTFATGYPTSTSYSLMLDSGENSRISNCALLGFSIGIVGSD